MKHAALATILLGTTASATMAPLDKAADIMQPSYRCAENTTYLFAEQVVRTVREDIGGPSSFGMDYDAYDFTLSIDETLDSLRSNETHYFATKAFFSCLQKEVPFFPRSTVTVKIVDSFSDYTRGGSLDAMFVYTAGELFQINFDNPPQD